LGSQSGKSAFISCFLIGWISIPFGELLIQGRIKFLDIRGFSWLTQAKSAEELKKRAFRTEIMGGRAAYFG
jgi:hypothetical protein